jgi:hypothetical protein
MFLNKWLKLKVNETKRACSSPTEDEIYNVEMDTGLRLASITVMHHAV